MTITILDITTIKNQLTNGWQRKLDTDKDPSNDNQWNTHSAGDGNPVGGLLGALTDSVLGTTFGTPIVHPVTFTSNLASRSENNLPSDAVATMTVANTFNDSVTDSSSRSDAVAVGTELSFEADATLFGVGGKAGGKFTMDYTHTNESANSTTKGTEQQFSQTIQVTIPPGRIYEASIVASHQKIDLPYSIDIALSGRSETWFADRVNDHYNWFSPVADVLSHMSVVPATYTFPGDGSLRIKGVSGTLSAQQQVAYHVVVMDVTDAQNPVVVAPQRSMRAMAEGAPEAPGIVIPLAGTSAASIDLLVPPGAKLISATQLPMPTIQ